MRREIYLLAIFLMIYNINLGIIENGDSIPASLLPFNILENHNLTLDYLYVFSTHMYHGNLVASIWTR